MTLRIFGDPRSGNCLKVMWAAEHLDIPYEWTDIDVMTGATRTPEFLAINPAGQVPTVILEDGRPLAQSNAIITYLAEGSDLVLVVGSANSSNSVRLVEVALRAGARDARLVDDASRIDWSWFEDVQTVGVTAGASSDVSAAVLSAIRSSPPSCGPPWRRR